MNVKKQAAYEFFSPDYDIVTIEKCIKQLEPDSYMADSIEDFKTEIREKAQEYFDDNSIAESEFMDLDSDELTEEEKIIQLSLKLLNYLDYVMQVNRKY